MCLSLAIICLTADLDDFEVKVILSLCCFFVAEGNFFCSLYVLALPI